MFVCFLQLSAGLVKSIAVRTEGKGRLGLEPSPFGKEYIHPGTETHTFRCSFNERKEG